MKKYHSLYSDDLVLLSKSAEGLQRSLDKLAEYAEIKSLTISIKKSKTMIFNSQGRHLKNHFSIKGNTLETVTTFCYLGFELAASGAVKHAINTLNEKAKKALRPLICAISRFNIPTKTAIKLFHTFVSPISLYSVEIWATLTDKKLRMFTESIFFDDTNESKSDVTHRKMLKQILGLSKSCPNMAIYGETGEIPLSLKGYRLMLNYWNRLTTLPDKCLAKKALIENANLRTNWILTIEKLIKTFNLIEVSNKRFKATAEGNIIRYYKTTWKNKLANQNLPRLQVYKVINSDFIVPKHLGLPFHMRKLISKIRCSSHRLEIERGRYTKTQREDRICKICDSGEVEDENHFLIQCPAYKYLREMYNMNSVNMYNFLDTVDQIGLAKYLKSSFELRERLLEGRGWG